MLRSPALAAWLFRHRKEAREGQLVPVFRGGPQRPARLGSHGGFCPRCPAHGRRSDPGTDGWPGDGPGTDTLYRSIKIVVRPPG